MSDKDAPRVQTFDGLAYAVGFTRRYRLALDSVIDAFVAEIGAHQTQRSRTENGGIFVLQLLHSFLRRRFIGNRSKLNRDTVAFTIIRSRLCHG